MTTTPRWAEFMPVADLPAAPTNAKAHDKGALAASVAAFGFVEPVVLDERTGRLVAGHGRAEHLAELQAAGGPPPDGVTVADDGRWMVLVSRGWASSDDAHAKAAGVALNRVGERGGWHIDELTATLDELAASPWADAVGWAPGQLDDLIASLAPPPADRWSNRPERAMPDPGAYTGGQVWQVGEHRIVVGDSRDPAVWAALPEAQLLVTDPPYGIGYTGGADAARVPLEDDDDPEVAAALIDTVLRRTAEHVSPGAGSYIFLPGGTAFPLLLSVVHRHGLHRWSLVWAKDQATISRADYHPQHEHISYGWFPGPRLVPVENRKLTTLWTFPRPRVSEHHPTAKPVALLQRAVEASSRAGDVVLDPFAGSGSTLVAAAKCGRVGVGIELRPEYARVAVDRLAEATGAEPKMVAGEPVEA